MSVNGDEVRKESRRYVDDGGNTINDTIMKMENIMDIAIRKRALDCVRLDPVYLNQEQIEYELNIRASLEAAGGPLEGNQKLGLVFRLRKMLADDKKNNRKMNEWTKEFESTEEWRIELDHCREAIGDLSRDIQSVGGARMSALPEWETIDQLGTLITHYYGRWGRINVGLEPYEHEAEVVRLLSELETCTRDLSDIYAMRVMRDRLMGQDTSSSTQSTEPEEGAPGLSSTHKRLDADNATEAVQDVSDWPEKVEQLYDQFQKLQSSGYEPKRQNEELDLLAQEVADFFQTVYASKNRFSQSEQKNVLVICQRLKGLKADVTEEKNRVLYLMNQSAKNQLMLRHHAIEKTKEWNRIFDQLGERRRSRHVLTDTHEIDLRTQEIIKGLMSVETEIKTLLSRELESDIREIVEQWLGKSQLWLREERDRRPTETRPNENRDPFGLDRFERFTAEMNHEREPRRSESEHGDDPLTKELCKTLEEREAERQGRRVQLQTPAKVNDRSSSSLDGSRLWPRVRSDEGPPPVSYHPCTPYHEIDYDEINSDVNGKPIVMTLHHKQQHLKNVMNGRRFDGDQKDNAKSLTIDEYIELMKRFRTATGASEMEVITQQYLYMTGRAHKWWLSHEAEIRTIAELEARLKSRFGTVFISPMQRLAQFTQRKQVEGEHLLDYMDDKRALARKLDQPLSEQNIIQEVVNSALWKYRCHLAARSYESLGALNRQMEYLCKGDNNKSTAKPVRPVTKPSYGYKSNRAVHATEAETVSEELDQNDEEEENATGSENNEQMELLVDLLQKVTKQFPQRSKQQSYTRKPTVVKTGAITESEKDIDALTSFRCYGCNAPGVMRRDCSVCQQKDNESKNGNAGQ